jgi:hypothetical protein
MCVRGWFGAAALAAELNRGIGGKAAERRRKALSGGGIIGLLTRRASSMTVCRSLASTNSGRPLS